MGLFSSGEEKADKDLVTAEVEKMELCFFTQCPVTAQKAVGMNLTYRNSI